MKNTARDEAKIWRRDANSFERMWHQAGKGTGTTWHTWAELYDVDSGQKTWFAPDGTKMLRFEVERVA